MDTLISCMTWTQYPSTKFNLHIHSTLLQIVFVVTETAKHATLFYIFRYDLSYSVRTDWLTVVLTQCKDTVSVAKILKLLFNIKAGFTDVLCFMNTFKLILENSGMSVQQPVSIVCLLHVECKANVLLDIWFDNMKTIFS